MKTTGAYLDWPYEGDEFDDRATTRSPQAICMFCIEVDHGDKI